MSGFLLRPSPPLIPLLPLIAIYAAVCLLWIGFANGIAPNIIAAAYNEQSLSVLNWFFQSHRSLPREHYLDLWNVIAAAVLIATVLHLVIVLFIGSIGRKHRLLLLDTPRACSRTNFVLIAFSAAFLAVTALSWAHGDYRAYLEMWMIVLGGRDPWPAGTPRYPFNTYGPLFDALALLVRVNPLTNKLLFAFSYLVYVIWLIKDFAPRRGLAAFSWPWLGLWLVNPFPWVEIAYFGYFDVLVGLACIAAVHSLVGKKAGVSGTSLALGILLKYMPIVILPFLVFSERRLSFRLLTFCVGVVICGLVVSVLIWGTSTFWPLTFAATRPPHWSIYDVLASTHSPLRLFWDPPNPNSLDWLEKPFLVTAGLGMFAWCMFRRTGPALSATLAVLATLLFYRTGYINYQMVPFLLISYWMVSEWERLGEYSALAALLGGYFGVLAILELVHWTLSTEDILYNDIVIFKFLLGCALLIGLVQFSASPRAAANQGTRPCGRI
jgi:Glycosyltransferase family 87